MTDKKEETNNQPKKDNSGRNRLLLAVGCGVVTYAVAVLGQSILYAPGWLGSWGVWVVAPMIASALAGRMALAWLRCRAASKSLKKERDLLMSQVRELTYNINNPLNAITAHLVSLKTEFNPGSVEQIEVSSRMIARIVGKLANIDLAALQDAEATAGSSVNVEELGRAGSL